MRQGIRMHFKCGMFEGVSLMQKAENCEITYFKYPFGPLHWTHHAMPHKYTCILYRCACLNSNFQAVIKV